MGNRVVVERGHSDVAGVAGQMSRALEKRTLRRSQVAEWATRLERVAEELRGLCES